MAKSSKTPIKRAVKAVKKEDDSTLEPVVEKAIQAESEARIFRVKANIEFYDMKAQVKRVKDSEWDETDEKRIGRLKSYGFITVL